MNLVRAIHEHRFPIDAVVGVSTDKAVKPVNVMGMTKAVQERILIAGNLRSHGTRFVCVRYGNVMGSRGSVIPLFLDQIRRGGPVTVTVPEMTRFLLGLDQAVDTVLGACADARRGETFVPRAPSATVVDIARALIGEREIPIEVTGTRPGEKHHEILVSEEECRRTSERDGRYVIAPMLPELENGPASTPVLRREYCSADGALGLRETAELLARHGLRADDASPVPETSRG
jgi:UDP-glucose 4-epimerase